MGIFAYLVALVTGGMNPVQSGANAQLNKSLDSPLWAAVTVYASGLLGVVLAQLIMRQGWPGSRMAEVPWWAWAGGLISIGSTIAALTLAQKMGAGMYTGLSLTASVLTSVALDHFGAMGFKQHPASGMRMLGTALMVGGIWLVAKF